MILNLIIIVSILFAIDLYGYYGLRKLTRHRPFLGYRKLIVRVYWFMDIGFLLFTFGWALIIRNSGWPDYIQYRSYFYITGAFILIFIPKIVYLIFNLLHDIYLVIRFIFRTVTGTRVAQLANPGFLPVLLTIGFILSLMMLSWVFYGIVYGRFNFGVNTVEVPVKDLPKAFDGYRIIHISDTHLGSFARTRPVARATALMAATPHDLLVFTGDMVNNEAVEAEKFVPMFASIQSSDGKFSILGNHDMGDYRRWYTIEEKSANLQQLQDYHQQMGFELLRNKHRFIVRGNDSIMIAGVDNWGLPPFAQLGDIDLALGNQPDFPFIILLSHDPSHWTAEVVPETNVLLTLSGHTHGMQAGIRTPWFQWSPVSLKYPMWNGLFQKDGQYLYVNRGLGFIGFPGRMGMRPEITLLVLRKKP